MTSPAARAGLLVVLTCLVYARAGRATFVFDDRPLILHNPRVIHPEPAWRYWADPHLIGGQELRGFRPLTMASFAWNYRLAGPSRAAFHVTSVGLHLATVLALWWLARGLLRDGVESGRGEEAALLAAAVFAVHPALSQTVLFLTARSSLIAALASLLAAGAYLRSIDSRERTHRGWYAASLVAWACALSGRESAIAAGILFAGIEWLTAVRRPTGWQFRACVARLAPFVVLGLLYIAWVFGPVGAHSTTPPARGWTANLIGQCAAAWEYTRLLLWPRGLALDHGAERLADSWTLQATLGLGVVLVLVAFAWTQRRRRPVITLGVVCGLIVIGPESYAMPLKVLVSEHRLYFPVACLALALAGACCGVEPPRRRALRALLVGTVSLLGAGTILRVRTWESAETLWADAWAKYPSSCRAPAHLGQLALEADDPASAVAYLEAALRCNAERLEPRLLLAQAYGAVGRHAEAYATAEAVIGDFPTSVDAYVTTGTVLAEGGRVEEALPYWRRALELDPDNVAARANLDRAANRSFDNASPER